MHDGTYCLGDVNGCQCVAQIMFTPPSDPNVFCLIQSHSDLKMFLTSLLLCVNMGFFPSRSHFKLFSLWQLSDPLYFTNTY